MSIHREWECPECGLVIADYYPPKICPACGEPSDQFECYEYDADDDWDDEDIEEETYVALGEDEDLETLENIVDDWLSSHEDVTGDLDQGFHTEEDLSLGRGPERAC